jgi:hypothetical protein
MVVTGVMEYHLRLYCGFWRVIIKVFQLAACASIVSSWGEVHHSFLVSRENWSWLFHEIV